MSPPPRARLAVPRGRCKAAAAVNFSISQFPRTADSMNDESSNGGVEPYRNVLNIVWLVVLFMIIGGWISTLFMGTTTAQYVSAPGFVFICCALFGWGYTLNMVSGHCTSRLLLIVPTPHPATLLCNYSCQEPTKRAIDPSASLVAKCHSILCRHVPRVF